MGLNLTTAQVEAACAALKRLHKDDDPIMRERQEENSDVLVTVTLLPHELKLLRRAIAVEADLGRLDRTAALRRICQLDVLRWNAEEKQKNEQ